jgi:phosphoglycerate dehydrogenase-like enzyme
METAAINSKPDKLNVLLMVDPKPMSLDDIAAVAPDRLSVSYAPPEALADDAGVFPEFGGLWRQHPSSMSLSPSERDTLLREAHVLVSSIPYPKRLHARMPNLTWVQFAFAGISDFRGSDLWGKPIKLTSARGYVEALPIAEMVIASAMLFAKHLHTAVRQTDAGMLDDAPLRYKLLRGKTMGVIGLGGIGTHVARLARALGMRTLATRRSATKRIENADGVDVLYPPSQLHDLLAKSDYICVSTALTSETERFLNADALAHAKDGACMLNVARGEVIDDRALKDALRSGKLGGAYLDVFTDEWTTLPDPELMAMPNVVMTPHNSGITDVDESFAIQLLCENLRLFLEGKTLINEVDWAREY